MKKLIMVLTAIMLTFSNVLAPPVEKEIKNPYKFNFSRATEKTALAIKYIESRGHYETKGLSGEFGAYQFRKKTWMKLSTKYYVILCEKFPNREFDSICLPMTAEMQDLIAKIRIQELYDNGYNVHQIAAIWNCGSSNYKGKTGINQFGIKYDVPKYVNKIVGKYNSIPD